MRGYIYQQGGSCWPLCSVLSFRSPESFAGTLLFEGTYRVVAHPRRHPPISRFSPHPLQVVEKIRVSPALRQGTSDLVNSGLLESRRCCPHSLGYVCSPPPIRINKTTARISDDSLIPCIGRIVKSKYLSLYDCPHPSTSVVVTSERGFLRRDPTNFRLDGFFTYRELAWRTGRG